MRRSPTLAAAILLLPVALALAQTKKPAATAAKATVKPGDAAEQMPEKQLITMDFQDVEIGVLVKFISEITGKNFILDEKVRGKVTVVSPTKITIDEAYRVFQSILDVKGFTTVPAGPVTKILPLREAKESGAPLTANVPHSEQFVTQLIPLAFVEASTLLPVLQPMVSKDGLISAYDASNTLLIIDSGSNVERVLSIISELDVELPERGIEIIPLQNSYAEQVAATLQDVLEAQRDQTGGKGPSAPGVKGAPAAATAAGPSASQAFRVLPEERTNAIIALAGPTQMRTIKSLVKELDKKLEGVSKINVYELKYANAVELVSVLGELIGGGGGGGGGKLGGVGALGGAGGSNPRRQTRQSQRQSSLGGGSRGSRQGAAGGLAQQLGGLGGAGSSGPGSPASASGSGGEFAGEVRVTADPYTNSLIISAGPQDYDVLKRVIGQLDVPRRQVYVEAIILELSLDKSRQLGLEMQGGVPLNDQGLGIGRLNLKNLNTALASPQNLSGLVLAAASNQTITLPDGTSVPAQVALFTALQSDTDVNILSAPTILTSDNQEAEILVGQNIPFIASRATSETNLSNTFATVERQDVGITLRLTPQISQGDNVRLDIYEEVSAVVPNPPVDASIAGPTTTVRSTSTTIVAQSGQTVVLGGLISDNVSISESKLPYIGDIPVIGNLFKFNDNRKNKINLLIFLTPRVIHDANDLRDVSSGERSRFKRGLAEQKTGPRRRAQLDAPSWDAAPMARGSAPPILVPQDQRAPLYSAPAPIAPLAPLPLPAPTPAVEAAVRPLPAPAPPPAPVVPSSPAALGIPSSGYRFVVLLAVWEQGTPPPELQTTNGFLNLYVPQELAAYWTKGGGYDYSSPRYEAKYTCLEVFPGTAEALAVYPEGQPLERLGGAAVRWKPVSTEQMKQIVAGSSPWKRR